MNNEKAAKIMLQIKDSLKQVKLYGKKGTQMSLIVSDETIEAFAMAEKLLSESAKTPMLTGKVSVGDEVIVGDDTHGYLKTRFIVTGAFEISDSYYLLNPLNGAYTIASFNHIRKTGKNYPKIIEAMKEAREGQE